MPGRRCGGDLGCVLIILGSSGAVMCATNQTIGGRIFPRGWALTRIIHVDVVGSLLAIVTARGESCCFPWCAYLLVGKFKKIRRVLGEYGT